MRAVWQPANATFWCDDCLFRFGNVSDLWRRRPLGQGRTKIMKTVVMDYFGEAGEQSDGVTVSMEVDDADSSLDMFGEGPVLDLHRLADAEFFNSFQDDFDDEYIN
ncbi:zinc finger C-x8-C-x5-C-x3-H type family protein [Striga asiatica]|uniref:Zinc finger C-x8-C-x5-C-x3-H type family protein n=1 Tax=Striga asiatica TaxID=4170 RepID=A0A5A7QE22_STRAF|nr:zinc finger C-x8-C-x5-C-x3-H type family protein [Striga asiatica]